MRESKDYDIPLASIGFYGSGICRIDTESERDLKICLLPISRYVDLLIEQQPIHISCRYLGYYGEVSADEIETMKPILRSIYAKYLPMAVEGKHLFGSWETRPDRNRKLIMLTISGERLSRLHQDLLKATSSFPVFRAVEGDCFNPHITLAEVKKEYVDHIPVEIADLIQDSGLIIPSFSFSGAYVWGRSGMENL